MAQEYRSGQIVPQSGVYKITHDPLHAEMPHEVKRPAIATPVDQPPARVRPVFFCLLFRRGLSLTRE
jgi:hypothetical protein